MAVPILTDQTSGFEAVTSHLMGSDGPVQTWTISSGTTNTAADWALYHELIIIMTLNITDSGGSTATSTNDLYMKINDTTYGNRWKYWYFSNNNDLAESYTSSNSQPFFDTNGIQINGRAGSEDKQPFWARIRISNANSKAMKNIQYSSGNFYSTDSSSANSDTNYIPNGVGQWGGASSTSSYGLQTDYQAAVSSIKFHMVPTSSYFADNSKIFVYGRRQQEIY